MRINGIVHWKIPVVILGISIFVISVGAWTYIRANGGEITVCINPFGLMRLLKEGEQCGKNETLLSWNIQGPKGEQGPPGPRGEQGPVGPQGPSGQPAPALPDNLRPSPVDKQFCFIPTGSGKRHITARWGLQNEFGNIPSSGISWGAIHLIPTNGGRMSFSANGTASELTVDVDSALVGFEGVVQLEATVLWGSFMVPVNGSKALTIDFDGRGCHPMDDSNLTVAIVQDNFNNYTNGSIVSQGNWNSYKNGENFVVQGAITFEGAKAIHANALADSVITKSGIPLADGRQAVYVRTENRSQWGFYTDGNAQFRVSKGPWGGSELRNFAAVSFKSDGNVAYYDPIGDVYQNFATYNDNEWTLLEIEWRSSDTRARYKVNNGVWTDWKPIAGSGSFTDFDHVGFDFFLPSGSGGVYFDNLH